MRPRAGSRTCSRASRPGWRRSSARSTAPRILRSEGDDPNRYKLAKQADTVLLFFLFSEEELREIFDRLGYEYTAETARRTIDYYDKRTSH